MLTEDVIKYQSSNQTKEKKLSTDRLSYISVHKIVRPTGHKKKKVPFRWRVKLIDKEGIEFKQAFKFQKEVNAEELASIIAPFYEVEIKRSEG